MATGTATTSKSGAVQTLPNALRWTPRTPCIVFSFSPSSAVSLASLSSSTLPSTSSVRVLCDRLGRESLLRRVNPGLLNGLPCRPPPLPLTDEPGLCRPAEEPGEVDWPRDQVFDVCLEVERESNAEDEEKEGACGCGLMGTSEERVSRRFFRLGRVWRISSRRMLLCVMSCEVSDQAV